MTPAASIPSASRNELRDDNIEKEITMKLKLFSTLLISVSVMAGGSAFAAAHPGDLDNFNNDAAKPAAPAAATTPAPKKVKKAKKAKAAPAATAKASQANITGPGTLTGPVSMSNNTAAAAAAPAPAK